MTDATLREGSALPHERIHQADQYLAARTGKYEWRRLRYAAAYDAMFEMGLWDGCTVFDVGSGWTELDYYMRAEHHWRGRYIPVDACIDGVHLDLWQPPRKAEFFVCLEVLEHLLYPHALIERLKRFATKGIVISTPNPETTDVLGMDPTHRREVPRGSLERAGFTVSTASFYGGYEDSLFGVWTR